MRSRWAKTTPTHKNGGGGSNSGSGSGDRSESDALCEGSVVQWSHVLEQFTVKDTEEEGADHQEDLAQDQVQQQHPSITLRRGAAAQAATAQNDAQLFQYSRNYMQLNQWHDLGYVYCPNRSVMQQLFAHRMDRYIKQHADGTNAHAHTASNYNGHGSASGRQQNQPPHHHLSTPLPLAPRPSNLSPAVSDGEDNSDNDDDDDDDDLVLVSNPVHEASTNISNRALATPIFSSGHHLLFDMLHLMLFMRLTWELRHKHLEAVEGCARLWLTRARLRKIQDGGTGNGHVVSGACPPSTASGKTPGSSNKKFDSIQQLQRICHEEKEEMQRIMNMLPTHHAIEAILNHCSRTAVDS